MVAWADRIAYVSHDFTDAVRAGILQPGELPDEIADVVGRSQSRQIGAFTLAVLEAIDRTGHIGMTEPEATALARFRAFNFERIYLRPAARRRRRRSWACCAGSSTSSSMRPLVCPPTPPTCAPTSFRVPPRRRRSRCVM